MYSVTLLWCKSWTVRSLVVFSGLDRYHRRPTSPGNSLRWTSRQMAPYSRAASPSWPRPSGTFRRAEGGGPRSSERRRASGPRFRPASSKAARWWTYAATAAPWSWTSSERAVGAWRRRHRGRWSASTATVRRWSRRGTSTSTWSRSIRSARCELEPLVVTFGSVLVSGRLENRSRTLRQII